MPEGEVSIYMRSIKLNVVIPAGHVWIFMAEFGAAFALKDLLEGGQHNRPVDSYYDHPNGWHVEVTVGENEEPAFYRFLNKFCTEKGLPLRKPSLV